ncbi:MAG: protein kinase [Blastocatellia bacterium]|nr:protein kinase [Blastocatellia bacterium]
MLPVQTISHYRVLERLGVSLIGEVYVAEDARLGRKVALTLLPASFTRDADRMQLLARESRALSSLNHPNIRMIYEVGSDREIHYIATEFVEGPTLRKRLDAARMGVEEVLDVAAQAVMGLAAAHAAGVLHRDLKPENVMLRPDGYVKILDFGLAKLVEQDTMMVSLGESVSVAELRNETGEAPVAEGIDPYRTRPLEAGEVLPVADAPRVARANNGLWWMPGTTGYLSPEQIRGEAVDERSDLFSFGVVLYEMCTGHLPFDGQTTTGVLTSIVRAQPAPLRRYMPEAPEELEWIAAKLLAKDREDRYQTARELLSDLKRLRQRRELEGARTEGTGTPAESAPASNPSSPPPLSTKTGDTGRGSARRETSHLGAPPRLSRGFPSASLADAIDSIAILPLVNQSDDPTAEYLSDGITESIINTLSRLPGLRVMARSTVFRYKGRAADPIEVGRELEVRAVMVGRLLQRGETIVIKAELVDAADGTLLWADQYRRQAGDIFELESEIARQISDHLRLKLTSEQQRNLAKRHTDSPEAYDLYLKGRFFWNQRKPGTIRKAIEHFVRAIRKDETYALAHCGLADCYAMLSWGSVPPREYIPKARLSISRALALDEQLSEAHASLGFLTLWYDWDFVKAENEMGRAIELNPNSATAHQWHAFVLAVTGRMDEAMPRLQHALRLDPLSIVITTDIAELLYRQRRYDEALAQARRALEMDREFGLAIYWELLCLIQLNRLDETFAAIEKIRSDEDILGVQMLLSVAHARAGKIDSAREHYERSLRIAEERYVPPYYFAMASAALGDNEQAFAWLEKAYLEHSGWMPWLKHDPMADSLRHDARFADLLRRIGMKP